MLPFQEMNKNQNFLIIGILVYVIIWPGHSQVLERRQLNPQESTAQDYVNYVKYLLVLANNYSLPPEQLSCTDVDPGKNFIVQFEDDKDGIRMCDLCPKLPFSKLRNLFVNVAPMEQFDNTPFSDCFGACSDRNECIAYSYDHQSSICYTFNTTVGKFGSQSNWTTVLINQPTGIINQWVYSRHTRISTLQTLTTPKNSTQPTFLTCLDLCDQTPSCSAISYSFLTKRCLLFTNFSQNSGNFVDFEYGCIAAFSLELTVGPEGDNWRFIEESVITNATVQVPGTNTNQSSKCEQPTTRGLGSFYSSKCLTTEALGCNRITGCQTCYYPEIFGAYRSDYIICEDSSFILGRQRREKLTECFKSCLNDSGCIAVDFNPNKLTCDSVRLATWRPTESSSSGTRRFSLKFSKKLPILSQFNVVPKRNVDLVPRSKTRLEQFFLDDLEICLKLCISKGYCTKVAYSSITKICKIASTSASTIDNSGTNTNDGFNLYLRKPSLLSHLLEFHQIPGWKLVGTAPKTKQISCSQDCSEYVTQCTTLCQVEYATWCSQVSIEYQENALVCTFINGSTDADLVPFPSSDIFTRYFNANFTLPALNDLQNFEEKDVLACFQNGSDQTTSTLAGYESIFSDNGQSGTGQSTTVSRRRRSIFSAIGNFFKKAAKKVVEVVKDTAKSIVNTVVDTAKGLANTVGKVVQGDWKGAGQAFMNIPIVQDVKQAGENIVTIGKSVVKGDWKGAGEAALDLATSNVVDFIPGGKIFKTGGKGLIDAIKGGAKKAERETAGKEAKDVVGDKASKDRKTKDEADPKKDDKDTERPDRCPRATSTRKKPGSSSSCKDDDDDGTGKCIKPNIANVMTVSLADCGLKKQKASCSFFCEPGYKESNKGKITCEKDPKTNKAKWTPAPQCDLETCSSGNFKLISITVPALGGVGLERTAFVSYFDVRRRLPVWSVTLMDTVNQAASFVRKAVGGFEPHPCTALVGKQATSAEYAGSGWHQGHLTPINAMLYHHKAAKASNLFVNIAPQSPAINTGSWKVLEMKVQCFTKTVSALVATGVCQKTQSATIGNGLSIPNCFWKMLCYKDSADKTQVVGFVATNDRFAKTDKTGKAKARGDLYTPRSQAEVKRMAGGGANYLGAATDPWIMSSKLILNIGNAAISPAECAAANSLNSDAADEWKKRLTPKKSSKKTRRKRAVSLSGCSAAEEEELAALFGFDAFDVDEDDIDNANEDEDMDGAGGSSLFAGAGCGKRLVGYYPSWGDKEITYQQARRLTHVIFAFLETKPDGTITLGTADPGHSADPGSDTALAKKRLETLKKVDRAFPHLQISFAVGGWENSQYFSSIAASPNLRLNFIANVIRNIDELGFDGVDIDWEYPVTGGAHEGVPSDKENYVQLMKELRQALDQHQAQLGRSDRFLITFAGAAGQWTLDPGYDLPGLFQYADWANVMTYDFFGAWDSKWGAYTGPPAPLYFAMPPRFSGKTNVDWTIKYYVCRSHQPHKITMGVPFYGRFWKNVGAPVGDGTDPMWRTAEAVGGKFEGGYEPWRNIKSKWLSDPGFQKSFHDKAKTPYAFNPATKTYLGYEDPQSLQFKAQYAADHNVGGLMIWAIDQDDDQMAMLNSVVSAPLCKNTNPTDIQYKCSPITEKRWWTSEDGDNFAGLCGRSAPLYRGYYPVCDPDDPGYSCCGAFGYCGSGNDYCNCPTCVDYRTFPERITEPPIKPTVPVQWYFLNAEDGKRGRCGRTIPKLNNEYPICNPNDPNAHCCSNGGYCGNKPENCQCQGCIDFKQQPNYRFPN